MGQQNLEGSLNVAVVSFMLQCVASRSFDVLENIGVDYETLGEFIEFTTDDLVRLGQIDRPIFRIKVDKQALEQAKQLVNRESSSLRNAFIKARAPWAMVNLWWPMSRNDFAAYRKTFSVAGSGRTPKTTESMEHALWVIWKELTQRKTIQQLAPADFYTIHERSGIDFDTIWPIVNAWAEKGMYGNAKRCHVMPVQNTSKG